MFRRKKSVSFWKRLGENWSRNDISRLLPFYVLYVRLNRKQFYQRHFKQKIFFLVCFMLFNNDGEHEKSFFFIGCLKKGQKLLKAYRSDIHQKMVFCKSDSTRVPRVFRIQKNGSNFATEKCFQSFCCFV